MTRGLEIRDLRMTIGGRTILDGIDLDVPAGVITGLAGESGSGKTMTGLAVCGLQPAGARLGGTIAFDDGEDRVPDLLALRPAELNRLRGRRIAMVFQDPTASLHPMLSIGTQLTDHLRHHLRLSRPEARNRAIELLGRVKVPQPETALARSCSASRSRSPSRASRRSSSPTSRPPPSTSRCRRASCGSCATSPTISASRCCS
jgi:peptide/nickel transport system ATP-binding protein